MGPREEPPWLDDEEQAAWRGLNGVLALLPAALDSQMQRDHAISLFEYLVLAMLSEAPDRTLQLKVLAARANGSLSRLSHALTRLEQRGWVRRAPLPGDGRVTTATLTDDGWVEVVAAAPSHVRSVRELVFARLDREQVLQLRAIADRVLEGLGPSPSR